MHPDNCSAGKYSSEDECAGSVPHLSSSYHPFGTGPLDWMVSDSPVTGSHVEVFTVTK